MCKLLGTSEFLCRNELNTDIIVENINKIIIDRYNYQKRLASIRNKIEAYNYKGAGEAVRLISELV
jgi:hypothetical protein